jgi:mono/diheme cytochrome c family protein
MPRSALLVVFLVAAVTRAAEPDFGRDVQPIFVKVCLSCHGPDKQKGGLRLDGRAAAMTGGDSGPVIVPGKAADSPLIRRVSSADPTERMPPKGEPLTAERVKLLRAWIDSGAAWPADAADPRADWWSLKPIRKPAIPALTEEDSKRARNPIDAFVLLKLREKGLRPSPEADRRVLIRRLSFDLTGLPPTPDEVDAFVNDPDGRAYEKLVDRLLDSPHYGERWARHWLDVVHYGDTHGYDKDKPRPFAYPYRDYVIRSLNADKPYGRFVREQVAGDVLFPGTADGIEALGFIAAGPWDFIGHVELPETKIDGKVARHLDRDDMVSNTIGTFMSVTVHCAQCHNHKFDPITQEDYYRLQAVFAAVDRTDRAYDSDPAVAKKRENWEARRKAAEARRRELDAQVAKLGGKALADLDAKIVAAEKTGPAVVPPEFGYHSAIEKTQVNVKWVQVDLGKSVALESVVLTGCHDDFNNIRAGFGFPVRFKVEVADDPEFKKDVRLITDHTAADYANPGTSPQTFAAKDVSARYVRVTATKLAPRQNDYIFALAELEAMSGGKNLARQAAVTALDSIEAPVRWRKSNLTDGIVHPTARPTKEQVEKLREERRSLFDRVATPELKKDLRESDAVLAELKRDLAKLPRRESCTLGPCIAGTGTSSAPARPGGSRGRSLSCPAGM